MSFHAENCEAYKNANSRTQTAQSGLFAMAPSLASTAYCSLLPKNHENVAARQCTIPAESSYRRF
jgi:hypothetical protein